MNMPTDTRCCRIDAIATIDARGQLVLPKEVRKRAGLKPNDKLAIICAESEGEACCIIMMRAEALADTLKETLGPMMKEIFK